MDHVAGNVGQAELSAVVLVGEAFVVHAEQVQDRGVNVVDRDRIDRGGMSDLIGLAVAHAPLDTAARHPGQEAVPIVVGCS